MTRCRPPPDVGTRDTLVQVTVRVSPETWQGIVELKESMGGISQAKVIEELVKIGLALKHGLPD
jgi:hypothetical protein